MTGDASLDASLVLDERLQPLEWTPGARRFTRDRLMRGQSIRKLYPERQARPIVTILEAVRDLDRRMSIELTVTGSVTDRTGRTVFTAEPVHEGSRIVAIRACATRPNGAPLYAPNAPTELSEGAFATLVSALGYAPEDGVAVFEIRRAARVATRDALRPLLPALRRAARAERLAGLHELPPRRPLG